MTDKHHIDAPIWRQVTLLTQEKVLGRRGKHDLPLRHSIKNGAEHIGDNPGHGAPNVPPSIAAPPAPTQQDGYDAGHAEGKEAGRRAGYEHGRSTGYREGRELGLREGTQEAEATNRKNSSAEAAALETKLKHLETLLASLSAERDQRLAEVEDDMLAIAFEAICRICGDKTVSTDGVRQMLSLIAAKARSGSAVIVHLHPDDAQWLHEDPSFSELLNLCASRNIALASDDRIILGGCMIETSDGTLDNRLETQLQRLSQLLRDVRATRKLADIPS